MRRRRSEAGYVLAAALAALLAMSIVAAALVAATVNEARRVAAAERAAADDATLDAAIVLAAADLLEAPGSRSLRFEGPETVAVGGRSITVTVGWESDKLDVNLASRNTLEAALRSQGLGDADRSAILRRFEARGSDPLSLVDSLVDGVAAGDSARAVLTTFGGRSDWTESGPRETIAIGVPAPGSRVWVVAEAEGPLYRAREAVLLFTGDPAAPVRVLDQRSLRGRREEGRDGS